MSDVTRTLKLIRLLKQRPGKTLTQLAQILECSPRHARRFMDALEEAGFIIDKEGKRPPRFYLFEDERRQQADFTEEEVQLLRQALAAIPGPNPLLAPLRQKVFQYSIRARLLRDSWAAFAISKKIFRIYVVYITSKFEVCSARPSFSLPFPNLLR